MKTILFIHQSADLYGSDKTLLYLVEKIKDEFNPVVVLPEEGPLTVELKKANIEVIINPVIKVSRELYASYRILFLPFLIIAAVFSLRRKLQKRKITIIHSNTLAVFLGAFYSKIYRIHHIWHVHEIIKHPKTAVRFYPSLVSFFSDKVIFNSKASYAHLTYNKTKLLKKSEVIYNGLDRDTPLLGTSEKLKLRNKSFDTISKTTKIVGLVGRINKHKGQHLLLNAFEQLFNQGNDIALLFIGSTTASQHYLLDKLEEAIQNKGLQKVVKIISFTNNIWQYYDIIDIVLVPTLDPEPFGLVALEGMLSYKPVIAADHGGLTEIVIHKKTGLLFEPNNEPALVDALNTLLQNPKLIEKYGVSGHERALTTFSLERYITNFKELYHSA